MKEAQKYFVGEGAIRSGRTRKMAHRMSMQEQDAMTLRDHRAKVAASKPRPLRVEMAYPSEIIKVS